MRILITGGAGFVGSHAAEYFANKGDDVICYDNLSRAELLKKKSIDTTYNWNYLKNIKNIELIKGDIRDLEKLKDAAKNIDVIIHTAAQTAITTSVVDPKTDFEINAFGTFNMLEAARINDVRDIVYCSTNKVYGDNVNTIDVIEKENRYIFEDKFKNGISESFPTDLCEHTPYGCSKFTGDIYCQEYGNIYGLKTGIFRMSCIYGIRQFGVEDQGWVSWFVYSILSNNQITIYGDGKQVRDILYITDLIDVFDRFIKIRNNLHDSVYNIGGGIDNSISLIELINHIKKITNRNAHINYRDWRLADQKVYISDINKVKKQLCWNPKIDINDGLSHLVNWWSKILK